MSDRMGRPDPVVGKTDKIAAEKDAPYVAIILKPIRKCADYMPKFGKGGKEGITLPDFQRLYGGDQFYSWFGLDNPLMYAAHKAAGGMTSVYRQIGIGCERLFQQILRDNLGLSEEDVKWSYEVAAAGGRKKRLSLDGRIITDRVKNRAARKRVAAWLRRAAKDMDVDSRVASSLSGIVFEVRQGYKSKDSKRQNADIANAATAYTRSYLPCALILSSQIDDDIALRYRAEKWLLLTGCSGKSDSLRSTYAFVKSVVGYDLAAFFQRNSKKLRREVGAVLKGLLRP